MVVRMTATGARVSAHIVMRTTPQPLPLLEAGPFLAARRDGAISLRVDYKIRQQAGPRVPLLYLPKSLRRLLGLSNNTKNLIFPI